MRNINALEGQPLATANAWEEIKRKGDDAIKKWIDDNMYAKTCVVALVGAETANRPWVLHEISKGWNDGKGVLAVRIHGLLDQQGRPSFGGVNPLTKVKFNNSTRTLADVAALKQPVGSDSKAIYASVASNIETWIEEAIQIRSRN